MKKRHRARQSSVIRRRPSRSPSFTHSTPASPERPPTAKGWDDGSHRRHRGRRRRRDASPSTRPSPIDAMEITPSHRASSSVIRRHRESRDARSIPSRDSIDRGRPPRDRSIDPRHHRSCHSCDSIRTATRLIASRREAARSPAFFDAAHTAADARLARRARVGAATIAGVADDARVNISLQRVDE